MNGIFFYIGLGVGLAAACGLRPFLPLLLAGALASSGALGVSFGNGSFHFLQESWWLLVVAVTLRPRLRRCSCSLGLAPTLDPGDGSPRGRTRSRRRSTGSATAPARCCSRAPSPRTATPGGPA